MSKSDNASRSIGWHDWCNRTNWHLMLCATLQKDFDCKDGIGHSSQPDLRESRMPDWLRPTSFPDMFDGTRLTLKLSFLNVHSVCTDLAFRAHVCCRLVNHKSRFKKEVITHFTVSSPAHNCISNLHVKVTAWVRSEFDFALTRYLTTQTDRCEAQWSTSLGLTLSSAFQN